MAADSSVDEGEDAVFILSRMDGLTRELSVNVSMAERGNVLVDGYQAPEQVTFSAGEQEVRLEIATEDDALDETDGELTLTLAEGDDYEVEAPGTAVVAVTDNDDAPQLTVVDARAAEDADVMVFTVSLNAPSALQVTVDYATSDGSATAGEDYNAAEGSLSFMPGDVERSISVMLTEDTKYEGDETFALTLDNPENAGLESAAATGTIADNDAMPELTVDDARAAEDAGVMVFTVSLNASSALQVTVDYATSDGSATAGEDYNAAEGSLKFTPGDVERTISVMLTEDTKYEGDETFALTLDNPENAGLESAAATGTIADNDAMPELTVDDARAAEDAGVMVFTVSLNAPSALQVTVDYATSDGSATAGEDYNAAEGSLSFMPGDVERSISVMLTEDTKYEGDETFALTLDNPENAGLESAAATGTIADNDAMPELTVDDARAAEDAGVMVFTVSLNAPSALQVTVDYATSDGSATAGEDYNAAEGSLSFMPGDVERSISVMLTEDTKYEGDETFALTLDNPENAGLESAAATGTIADNDAMPELTVDDARAAEDAGVMVFTVSLNASSALQVTVDYATSDGSATAGEDYNAAEGSLKFTPGDVERTISVMLTEDTKYEGDETFALTLDNPENAGLESAAATGTIADNDTMPELTVDDARAAEDAGVMVFTVSLNAPSALQVTVDYATSDGSATAGEDYNAAEGSLSFMPGDVERSISVMLTEDTKYEGDETFALTLDNPENAGLESAAATGTIADNDAMPELTVDDARAAEDAGVMVFTVSLNASSALQVTVDYATSDGSATAGEDYTATDGSLKFTPGDIEGTISVLLQEDTLHEGDETFALTLDNPENAGLESAAATGTIADNDTMPELTVDDARAAEDAGVMVFTVSLNAPSALQVTVDYATSDGSATAGEDYTAAEGSLKFTPGDIEGTISVLLQEDTLHEGDETFALTLDNPENAGLESAAATGTIADNDAMPELTVDDARAAEDAGVMVFTVSLNASSALQVTVDYATSDGSATAGEDYNAAGGSLSFMPGDIERTISVLLNEDEIFEGDETLSLTLSNPVNAGLADDAATGTIVNDDDNSAGALAWLSRFGRTVATQVVDTLESRFYGAFTDESSVTLGGLQMHMGLAPAQLDEQALGWHADMAFIHGRAWTDADRQLSGAWSPDMRRWLSTSSFHWTSAPGASSSANGGLAGAASGGYGPWGSTAARITYWGRGALTEFDGRDGDITLDGDVLTGILASDYEDERLLAGLAVGYSDGDGSYRTSGTEGDLDASLVSIYPYARLEVTDNISAWAVLGYGTGDMKMTTVSGEATVDTDIEMKLGAMGIRGVLLSTETLDVALKSDAFLVSMDADATEGIESPLDTDVGRVRLLLEGSHSRTLSGGGILRPAVELGLRYDDSDDAETGFGVELGGALRYSDPARGVTMEAKARALLAHEDGDYEEWGVGGYLHLDPSAAEQGFWLRLDSSWGVLADGENRLWAHQNTGGLASDTYTNPTGRLNLELGYAMDVPGSYGVLIPYSSLELTGDDNRTYRLGWRYKLGESLYMSLDGVRHERYDVSPDHGLMLRTTLPW